MVTTFLTLSAAARERPIEPIPTRPKERDQELARRQLVNRVVVFATRTLFAARPGRRRAAVTALWVAITDCDGVSERERAETADERTLANALATYGRIEPEQRQRVRATLSRAALDEVDVAVARELGQILHRTAQLEALALALEVNANMKPRWRERPPRSRRT